MDFHTCYGKKKRKNNYTCPKLSQKWLNGTCPQTNQTKKSSKTVVKLIIIDIIIKEKTDKGGFIC